MAKRDDVEVEVRSSVAPTRTLRVSSASRVVFPATDTTPAITKLDLVNYSIAVGEPLYRVLRERPTTLERWPNGVHPGMQLGRGADDGGFYQKRMIRAAPDFVDGVEITFPSGRTAREVCPTEPAVLAWCVGEALMRGKASMLGAASGAVAGLVAITPAAGNVGIGGALVIGFIAGFACLWGVNGLKHMLGADDSLDVFGVHGVGGIVGALLTGVFNSPALGGPGYVADWVTATAVTAADYSIAAQVWTQAKAVLTTIVWSGVVSFVAYKIVDLTIGLRVSEEDEREGLDITSHGETAYNR